uniref:Retrotransposon gag domain-containing protein n=1 Tax=Asparagus officinalis TaxID=4686 RepID=Q2AA25_ASPOF|nr:hypothetical protein 20.t00023 [Asparagus officinalis]
MATVLAEKKRKSESVNDFVKRFRNRSVHCRNQVENMIKRLEAEEPHPKKGALEPSAPRNPPRPRGNALRGNTTLGRIKLLEVTKPEEVNKTDDPSYCTYHRFLGHHTSKCYILKDKLQTLYDVGVLKKEKVQKKVTTNMVILSFGTDLPEVHAPTGVVPIPKAVLKITNADPHNQREKGLVSQTLPSGQVMWVHPDLLSDKQWTSKSSGKPKGKPYNVISAIPDGDKAEMTTLTDSKDEADSLATRASREFAKNYPPRVEDPTGPSLKNIPARITLYELLRLSKSIREALQVAVADSEAFATHFLPKIGEEVARGYIGYSKADKIQVDPGSTLSIIPLKLIKHLGVPQKRLSVTTTNIFGFNATETRPLRKIRLKCRLGNMKMEVTCYVIDAEPSYNMLLGRP